MILPRHCTPAYGPFSHAIRPASLVQRLFLSLVVVGASFSSVGPVYGHSGEQHGEPAPGTAASGGTVRLSPQSKENLGLQTEEAQFRSIETDVRCFGIVEGVPDRVNFVSTRVPGRASRVLVNLGDPVRTGEVLAEVESRQIGNPPPIFPVTATLSGIVTQRHLLVGESIEPDKTLFQIADLSEVRVKCDVYEADSGNVHIGQQARVNFEAFPQRTFDGSVEALAGELNIATRSLPVWIRLPNRDLALRPNMRGEGRIVVGVADTALTVPVSSVLGDAGNQFVYLDTGKQYERKSVVLGPRDNRFVEILDGLVPGDLVVTQGNYQLQFAVSLAPEPAQPAKVGP